MGATAAAGAGLTDEARWSFGATVRAPLAWALAALAAVAALVGIDVTRARQRHGAA